MHSFSLLKLFILSLGVVRPSATGACSTNTDCHSGAYYTTQQDICFMASAFPGNPNEGQCVNGQCTKKKSLGELCLSRRHSSANDNGCVTGLCSSGSSNCEHRPGVGDQCVSLTTTQRPTSHPAQTPTFYPTMRPTGRPTVRSTQQVTTSPPLYSPITCGEVKRGRISPFMTVPYSLVYPQSMTYMTVSTCGSSFDTKLSFYDGVITSSPRFGCDDCSTCSSVADECALCGEKSSVIRLHQQNTQGGTIVVSGYEAAAGSYLLYFHCCTTDGCNRSIPPAAGQPSQRPPSRSTTRRPSRSPTPAPTCSRIGLTQFPLSVTTGLARGLNVFTDETAGASILDLTSYSRNKSTLFRNCLTSVPDMVQTINEVASCAWKDVSVEKSHDSYHSFAVGSAQSISAAIGLPITSAVTNAFGSLSQIRTDAATFSSTKKSSFFEMRQECLLVHVGLVAPAFWTLTTDFLADVRGLPKSYNRQLLNRYQTFWSSYGTHVFRNGRFGGEFEGVFASDTCAWNRSGYTRDEVRVCIGASIKENSGQVCAGNSVEVRERRTAGSMVSMSWALVRGGSTVTFRDQIEAFLTPNGNSFDAFETWLSSVGNSMAIIEGTAMAIHEMLFQLVNSNHRQFNSQAFPDAWNILSALSQAYNDSITFQSEKEMRVVPFIEECASSSPSLCAWWWTVLMVAGLSLK